MASAELLQSLSGAIEDYREGEVQPRSPELIDAWLQQFPAAKHDLLLQGLVHVFGKTYISRESFDDFLKGLAASNKVSKGVAPEEFWRGANFLNIQRGGNSQREILEAFDEILQSTHGFALADTGSTDGAFIYLDDCIGTGSRVRSDVCAWLEGDTPKNVVLHVITPVLYAGSWWIDGKIRETAAANGKTISVTKWRLEDFQMENRMAYRNRSDVLWPTALPDEPTVEAYSDYLKSLGHAPIFRSAGNPGVSGLFADDAQKVALEELLLTRGCQIRQECSNLPDNARPLGYHNLDCFGFGSMFVTFRNCPNNCPLAFWVQQAAYPALFPRKTNTQARQE